MIELFSESDTLQELRAKIDDWISNWAQLGWLIDPYERQVFIYRPGKPPECVKSKAQLAGEGPVKGFVLNLAMVWECYRDYF